MKKIFLVILLLLSLSNSWSQKRQIIAYIDMEYILENVPEYTQAQTALNQKIDKWKKNLDKQQRHIEILKTDLANEKTILTKDLIAEKEEEITLKQEELRRLESLYFGSKGKMFLTRKQLVEPVQDQVYNAIQKIASKKRYDFVFDKSSDLVMLYSNKKYDISDLVLATINRTKLIDKKKTKKNAPKVLTDKQKQILNKKEVSIEKKATEKEAKKKKIENRKKILLEREKAKKKKIEERKRLLLEKKEAKKRKEQIKKE